ncbi:MAG: DUF4097 domain-containing protein [Clostridia bacterium]|nr:DUF4097 domain-containing protein [Clostridia bacterium]
MSVNEEKMFILKMLEEGKISSEEAAKLIEALEGNKTKQYSGESIPRQQKQPNFQEEIFKMREKVNDWRKDFKNNYSQKDFDHMVDEFSVKAEKVGKNLATTTFGIVDKVIDFVGSFVDTSTFNIFGSYATVERNFEALAVEGMELNLEGINGHVVVKKHADNKIVIKSRVKSPVNNADNILMFSDSANAVDLKINKIGNISVSHEVLLPTVKFGKIKLETANGRIYVEDSISKEFEAITRNSHIELMGVNSEKVSVSTKNARIQINYVIGKDIDVRTNNSLIDIKHIKLENLNAVTTNSKIFVENAQNYESSRNMNMYLKTTNADIKVNMNDMEKRGYKVKAQTTNGGINLLIPEIIYNNINKQGIGGSFVEAESNGYEAYAEKVHINAETANAFIEIVK